MDCETHALAYAAAGLEVLPLHTPVGTPHAPPCPCRRTPCPHVCSCMAPHCGSAGKHPRCAGGHTGASSDPDVVRRWWAMWPTANIGLRPSPGRVVVDVDPRHQGTESLAALVARHGPLVTETWWAHTGGSGLHFWYRSPGPHVSTLGPGLDLKGRDGFLVVAPSLHASGLRYTWGSRFPVADAPPWLAALMTKRPPAKRKVPAATAPVTSTSGHDGLVLTVAGAAQGNRNRALYWSACRAVESGSPPGLLARIAAAARANGLGDPDRGDVVTLGGRRADQDEVDRTIGSALTQAGVLA